MAHERTCYVSKSHKYKYCPYCAQYKHLPTFMFTYCSENCKDIDKATADYANGHITADEAEELLLKCDLSDYDNFRDDIKSIITEINEKTSKKEEETPVVEVVETKKKAKKKIVNDDLLKTEESVQN